MEGRFSQASILRADDISVSPTGLREYRIDHAGQHLARPALAGIAEGEPGAGDGHPSLLLREQVAEASEPLSGSTVSR